MIHFKIYNTYKELPKEWDSSVSHDLLLQTTYLEALENATPNNISMYYVGVFNKETLISVAIIQRVQLYLKDMFRNTKVSCFKEFIQNNISRVLKGNILVVGNLTHTGQHGVCFCNNNVPQAKCVEVLFEAILKLKKDIKVETNKTIRVILFKDYFKEDTIHNNTTLFASNQYYKMQVQPNMIMSIRPDWLTVNDYLGSMTKKYRDRYKRARKKFNSIKSIELDLESVKSNSKRLYKLYKNVSNNAAFNTFILPENHFFSLKLQLQENFKVFGYFLDDELIGFYTLILNNGQLETYFLGYDKEHQYPNQLYLNMLYDMAAYAIENKFTSVVYARTAMEIKSSVGAIPETMFMYLKHTNRVVNAILKLVFNLMNPSQDWKERHPFKT